MKTLNGINTKRGQVYFHRVSSALAVGYRQAGLAAVKKYNSEISSLSVMLDRAVDSAPIHCA